MKRSVTSIASTKGLQPRGGFLPISQMEVGNLSLDSDYAEKVEKLLKNGNISDSLMGQCFDYGVKLEYIDNRDPDDCIKAIKLKMLSTFSTARCGARMIGEEENCRIALDRLYQAYNTPCTKYDRRKFIPIYAELARYEAISHSGNPNLKPMASKATKNEADALDYMINTTVCSFWDTIIIPSSGRSPRFYGKGAKNVEVSACDLLFDDAIVELKYSKNEPTPRHTFQLLLYYLMGLHERPEIFKWLWKLIIINPRIGKFYSIETGLLDKEMLKHIELDIMGYETSVVDHLTVTTIPQ